MYQFSITPLTSRPDDPSNSPSVRSTISSEITAAVSKFISLLENNYEYEHTSLLHPPSFLTHPPPPFILNSPFTSTLYMYMYKYTLLYNSPFLSLCFSILPLNILSPSIPDMINNFRSCFLCNCFLCFCQFFTELSSSNLSKSLSNLFVSIYIVYTSMNIFDLLCHLGMKDMPSHSESPSSLCFLVHIQHTAAPLPAL